MTGFGMYDRGWLVAAAVAGCSCMTAPLGATMTKTDMTSKIISPIPPIIGFVWFFDCLTKNV